MEINDEESSPRADYLTWSKLNSLERRLVVAALEGNRCVVDPLDPARSIRAQVVYQLVTGKGKLAAEGMFDFEKPRSVRLEGASISGSLNLAEEALVCPLALTNCLFDDNASVNLTGAKAPYITLDALRIDGDVLGKHLSVDRDLTLANLSVGGRLQLQGADIKGQLVLDGSTIESDAYHGYALNLRFAHVGEGIAFTNGEAFGVVLLDNAHIGGNVNMAGTSIIARYGRAISANEVTIAGSLYCRHDFRTEGQIWMAGAEVRGQINFAGASIGGHDGMSLCAEKVTVGASILFVTDMRSVGMIWLNGAKVNGSVTVEGSIEVPPGTVALVANRMVIDGALYLDSLKTSGYIDLRESRLENLIDDEVSSSVPVRCGGLSYARMERRSSRGSVSDSDFRSLSEFARNQHGPGGVRKRLSWLKRDPDGYSPQPYSQLARVYKDGGFHAQARLVLATSERLRWGSGTGRLRGLRKFWGHVLNALVGYGYMPWRAIYWSVLVLTMSVALLEAVAPKPVRVAADAPPLNTVLYSLDLFLPIIDLGYSKILYSGWAQILGFVLTVCGWILVTAVVAAFSSMLRRSD